MQRQEWEQAVARAAIERSFRARLLADPVDALRDYGLGAEAAKLVQSLRASSLPEFVGNMLGVGDLIWGGDGARPRLGNTLPWM